MHNTDRGYGWMAKALHWAIFLLFINQFIVAAVMLNNSVDLRCFITYRRNRTPPVKRFIIEYFS